MSILEKQPISQGENNNINKSHIEKIDYIIKNLKSYMSQLIITEDGINGLWKK